MSNSGLMADISNNNGQVNIDAYARAGFRAIAIKATEGVGFVDPDHRGWALAAGGHHLSVFHYHFARPDDGNNGADEAKFFLNNTRWALGPRDYVVLDLERGGPSNTGIDPQFSRDFDAVIREHSRFYTIVYATRSALESASGWLDGSPAKRLWDADWSAGPDCRLPGYYTVLRQFTDGVYGPDPHVLPGIGRGDVSVIRAPLYQQIVNHR